jgi:hypothetical protein
MVLNPKMASTQYRVVAMDEPNPEIRPETIPDFTVLCINTMLTGPMGAAIEMPRMMPFKNIEGFRPFLVFENVIVIVIIMVSNVLFVKQSGDKLYFYCKIIGFSIILGK